ncbi:MAG: pseudouridine synthase [Alphaproteobacteria bacterium]|nr:MAG: hypothetical protein B6I23_01485 [Rickettsiaceae bacterium 4572_127]
MFLIKKISHSGYCSRRVAEKLIRNGAVEIDGKKVLEPATKVSEKNRIKIEGKELPQKPEEKLFIFHKPTEVLTSHKSQENRKIIFDFLPKWMKNYHAIGRLDFLSEGLILLTNSPELKEKMERGDFPRVYEVKIHGKPHKNLIETLKNGVKIEGIFYKSIKVEIKNQNDGSSWLSMTLTEGKNREIRKILAHFNYKLLKLKRVSYGEYKLGNLEVKKLKKVY